MIHEKSAENAAKDSKPPRILIARWMLMMIHLTEKAPPAFIVDADDRKLVHSTYSKAVIDGDGENFSGKQ